MSQRGDPTPILIRAGIQTKQGTGARRAQLLKKLGALGSDALKGYNRRIPLGIHNYDHGFCLAKASFSVELGLVLRCKIATAPVAKATKHGLKNKFFRLYSTDRMK